VLRVGMFVEKMQFFSVGHMEEQDIEVIGAKETVYS